MSDRTHDHTVDPTTNAGPVLIAFDGSPAAREAIRQAGELVRPGPAVIVTAWEMVRDLPIYATGLSGELVARLSGVERNLDDSAREAAEETAHEGVALARASGFDATPRVVAGRAPERIAALAEDLHARLIVLGARGLSRSKSVLLGSVTASVVHRTRRPTLVVPAPDPPAVPEHRAPLEAARSSS
jgi:nucleotide-binding universal stress UspA family protein